MLACTGVCQGTRDREPLVLMGVQHSGQFLKKSRKRPTTRACGASTRACMAGHTGVYHTARACVCLSTLPCLAYTGVLKWGSHTRACPLGHTGVCVDFHTHTGRTQGRVSCRFEATRSCPLGRTVVCSTQNLQMRHETQKSNPNTSNTQSIFN